MTEQNKLTYRHRYIRGTENTLVLRCGYHHVCLAVTNCRTESSIIITIPNVAAEHSVNKTFLCVCVWLLQKQRAALPANIVISDMFSCWTKETEIHVSESSFIGNSAV